MIPGKNKIIIVSQYFYPEKFRVNDLAADLVKRGYEVEVITGIPNYPQGKFYQGYGWFKNKKEVYQGVKITRVPIVARGKNPIQLVLNYYSFVMSGFIQRHFSKKKADLVLTYEVSPMTQGLVGLGLARKLKVPHMIYVLDLWPENLVEMTGLKNKTLLKPINKMVDKIYSGSTLILAASKGQVQSIIKRNVLASKVKYFPQYYEEIYAPSEIKSDYLNLLKDGLNLVFTGNVGDAQGLDLLIDVGKKINDSDLKVKFHIVGDGRGKKHLLECQQTHRLQDVIEFYDSVNVQQIPSILASCDGALLTSGDYEYFKVTIPAKVQSYMACGIPILGSISGETQEIINQNNCGFCVDSKDVDGFFENIKKFIDLSAEEKQSMSNNCIQVASREFSKEKLMDQLEEYIDEQLI